jgi:hypothetical protein
VVDRRTGVATSTDLVTWTKDAAHNPLFSGGIFCVDVVRWDKPDGTPRWVMFAPHYTLEGDAGMAHLEVWSSTSPLFYAANRTYEGIAFVSAGATSEGVALSEYGIDVPHIVVEGAERNLLTSTATGDEWWMALTVVARKPHMEIWRRHKTTPCQTLSDVDGPDPSSAAYRLATYQNDANTKFLLSAAQTGTLLDLSGNGAHVSTNCILMDATGVHFTAASGHRLRYQPTTLAALDGITGDFTIEWRCSFDTTFNTSYRAVLAFASSTADRHFYLYATGSGGESPVFRWNLLCKTAAGNVTGSGPASQNFDVGVLHRWAVSRTNGNLYWFLDGVLQNAGGTAFTADALSSTPGAALRVGTNYDDSALYWNGYIDEVRFSDSARWTANYTAAAPTLARKATGYVFSPVYDLGTDTVADLVPTNPVIPAGCAVEVLYRAAADLTDASSDVGDFDAVLPAGERYIQYAFVLTGDGAETPLVEQSGLDFSTLPDLSIAAAKTLTLTPGQS